LNRLHALYHSGLGYTAAEIATEMGVSARYVRTGLKLLRQRDGSQAPRTNGTAFRKQPRQPGVAVDALAGFNGGNVLAPNSSPVGFLGLKEHHCRFPVEGEGAGMVFCGAPKEQVAYCGHHAMICYRD